MKKHSFIVMLAVVAFPLLSTGCHKPYSHSQTDFNWTGTAPLSVDIDGTPYQATQSSVASPTGAIVLTGSDGSSTSVEVVFKSVPSESQKYNAPDAVNFVVNTQSSSSSDSYSATTGEAEVTSLVGNTIEGKFYGTVKDTNGKTHVLTNGYFKMSK